MTADQFFAKYINQGIDFDGAYGYQCVDVWKQYEHDVILCPVTNGNAIDIWTRYPQAFFERIDNSPNNCPVKGDVVIWGSQIGQYGHIAICSEADPMKFTSFDQNWPIGSVCHFQNHTYVGVLGWLRPKVTPSPDIPVSVPEPVPQPVPEPPQTAPEPPTSVPEPIPTIPTPPVPPENPSPIPSFFAQLITWIKKFLKLG